jgi:outer membrane murein-binding lipoprotein Lpp
LSDITPDSSESEVVAALTGKIKPLNDKITQLEADVKAQKDGAIKALLDDAQAAGKITVPAGKKIEDVRATYEKIGQTSGIEALATILGGIPAPKSIAGQITPEASGANGDAPKTFDELVGKGEAFIAAFKVENKEAYAALYKKEFGHEPKI